MRRGWLATAVLLMVILVVFVGCANKWLTSGKIAMNSKNWEKAIGDFQKALADNPENGEAHMYLAKCYKETDQFEKMVPHLDDAKRFYPKGKEKIEALRREAWLALFNAGDKNAKDGKFEQARDELETAISIWPQRSEAYAIAGYVWENLNNNDSAFYFYSEAYRLEPEKISVLDNYARHSYNMGKYDLADSLFVILLESDPNNSEAYFWRGEIARERKEFEKAIDFYNSALKLDPDNCDLWFYLGVLHFRELGNNDEAIAAFSRTVEICPDNIDGHINLNVALISSNRFDEAIENLEVYVQDFPDDCSGWDLYSQALLRNGMKKQALDAYKKYEECSGGK